MELKEQIGKLYKKEQLSEVGFILHLVQTIKDAIKIVL